MRVIGGKYRSRKIRLPKGMGTDKTAGLRPTSDRARETLFDILNNEADFDNSACLDLFAGTGTLGFEALSRGADSAVFVDLSAKNIEAIKITASELGCSERVLVFKEDALHYLRRENDRNYDFVFADPPYNYGRYDELTELVLEKKPILFVLETSGAFKSALEARGYIVREKKVGAAKFLIFISK